MKTMATLIQDFTDDTSRNTLGPSLALLIPGHWGDFIRWAAGHGYTVTPADIRAEADKHPGMMKAFAAHPRMKGWTRDSLEAFAVGG